MSRFVYGAQFEYPLKEDPIKKNSFVIITRMNSAGLFVVKEDIT